MSGNGWTELDFTDADVPWPDVGFKPHDVDFDSQGRIYVANYYNGALYGRAFRIDDITGVNFTPFTDRSVAIVAVAVDQYNDYMYYASSTQLWRVELDGTNDTPLSIAGITAIRGMTVGHSGQLYIAGNGPGFPAVFRYDPFSESVARTYVTSIANPWDTYFRTPHVYVANLEGSGGNRILQLDENLSFIDGYGNPSTSADSAVGNFYGPKRFIGILPKKLVILDEGSTMETSGFIGDRLIAIDDLSGAGWQTYGTTGSGVGQFNFYWFC
jgi:hypothetical protein